MVALLAVAGNANEELALPGIYQLGVQTQGNVQDRGRILPPSPAQQRVVDRNLTRVLNPSPPHEQRRLENDVEGE